MLNKHLGFALSVVAIGLFVPGIILPMFTLSMDMAVAISGTGIDAQLVDRELSILTTVQKLWEDERLLVAALIFIFSVVIPITKSLLLTVVYFAKTQRLQQQITDFVSAIGKWSMADVFVVAVFLAVLSTNYTENAQQQEMSFLGMRIGFEISTQTLSNVGEGFYYFTAYCLVSLAGSQLMLRGIRAQTTKGA
ncbi:paraquat-inducible protein A [Glaciecola siphonariae]|uniref:Paraquat-inducible protein A n=1 Tax=Glaciecola siphonariae TaxID=521012 RepID=A0ABV9LYA1_9ALTE